MDIRRLAHLSCRPHRIDLVRRHRLGRPTAWLAALKRSESSLFGVVGVGVNARSTSRDGAHDAGAYCSCCNRSVPGVLVVVMQLSAGKPPRRSHDHAPQTPVENEWQPWLLRRAAAHLVAFRLAAWCSG